LYARGPAHKRFDTSVVGWNIQAFKAATMAGSSNTNLPAAVEKSIMFLKTQAYAQNGSGFVYSGVPGHPIPARTRTHPGPWPLADVRLRCGRAA
jgi:hypothetical protein